MIPTEHLNISTPVGLKSRVKAAGLNASAISTMALEQAVRKLELPENVGGSIDSRSPNTDRNRRFSEVITANDTKLS